MSKSAGYAGIRYSWVKMSKCSNVQPSKCYYQQSVSLHLSSQCFSPFEVGKWTPAPPGWHPTSLVPSIRKQHLLPNRSSKSSIAEILGCSPSSYVVHFSSLRSRLKYQFLVKTSLTTQSKIAPYLSHLSHLYSTLSLPDIILLLYLLHICTTRI